MSYNCIRNIPTPQNGEQNQYLGQQIKRIYLMQESTNTNNMIEVGTRKHDSVCVAKLFYFFFLLRSLGKVAKCIIIGLLQFAVQYPKLSSK
jgi:hypothetical protein